MPDAVKAAPLEGGSRAVIVPKMIYRIGCFRPAAGLDMVTGPETHEPDRHTAVINASRQVRQQSGHRRMAADRRAVETGEQIAVQRSVKTIGLPIPCNFR